MILLTIGFGILSLVTFMQIRDVYKLDKQLEYSRDRQGYLENRLRETEKFADGLDKHLWILNGRLSLLECTVNRECTSEVTELPETDIETVKETIK